jgi:hypothetical protein
MPGRAELTFALAVPAIAIIYRPVEHVLYSSVFRCVWNSMPYLLLAADIPFLFKANEA